MQATTLRLGFFSGAVSSWDPSQVAEAVATAGFDSIEWQLGSPVGHIRAAAAAAEDARARKRDSDSSGLRVCAVSAAHTVSLLDDSSIGALVQACVATGATIGRVFAPPLDPGRPIDDQLADVHHALARHAASFEDHGVRLVIELSEETIVPSPELLRRVCTDLDPASVGALYDPANMLVEGNLAPALAIGLLGEYLHHVHVKNEIFARSADGRWAPKIVQADEGIVDWPDVFLELRAFGYNGWIVIDHLSGEASVERLTFERHVVERLWAESFRGPPAPKGARP